LFLVLTLKATNNLPPAESNSLQLVNNMPPLSHIQQKQLFSGMRSFGSVIIQTVIQNVHALLVTA